MQRKQEKRKSPREKETRIELLESATECRWREKDSTETSCDRKRRFSGSHSRLPLLRLRQPPPFDVPLFRSFRPADSSRIPLPVSLAARLADYNSAYITTAVRQFDSSIGDRGISSVALFSSSIFYFSSSSPPPTFSAILDLSSSTYQFNKIVALALFKRCDAIRHSRCSFAMLPEKFSLFNAAKGRQKEKGNEQKRKREREKSIMT